MYCSPPNIETYLRACFRDLRYGRMSAKDWRYDNEHSFLWRWDLVIVTYNVWNKTPECFFRLHGASEVFSFSQVYLLLLFMGKVRGKGRSSLHCSYTEQGFSVWPFRSEPFRSGRFGLSRFDHGTFRSDYEILQKLYVNAKSSSLIQSALPPSSYCRLPKVEAFHSKRTKRCRQWRSQPKSLRGQNVWF